MVAGRPFDRYRELQAHVGWTEADARRSGEISTQWSGTIGPMPSALARAEHLLLQAGRVLVDASFRETSRRRRVIETARRWGADARLLLGRAEPQVVRRRLEQRRDHASDAGWSIYLEAARRWEEPDEATRAVTSEFDAGGACR